MLKEDVRTVISRMSLFSLPKQSCEVKTLCFGDMSQFSNVNYCELRNVIQRKESVHYGTPTEAGENQIAHPKCLALNKFANRL